MNWKQIRWKIRYTWQYFPFTLNTVLCVLAGWGAFKLLYTPTPKGEEPSPFVPFIILMGKLALWFVVALVGLSVVSTFFSFFYYLWLRRSKGYKLQVSFTTETKAGKKNRLYLNARLEGVIRPALGFIKGRLFYDDNVFTDRFSLLFFQNPGTSLFFQVLFQSASVGSLGCG